MSRALNIYGSAWIECAYNQIATWKFQFECSSYSLIRFGVFLKDTNDLNYGGNMFNKWEAILCQNDEEMTVELNTKTGSFTCYSKLIYNDNDVGNNQGILKYWNNIYEFKYSLVGGPNRHNLKYGNRHNIKCKIALQICNENNNDIKIILNDFIV